VVRERGALAPADAERTPTAAPPKQPDTWRPGLQGGVGNRAVASALIKGCDGDEESGRDVVKTEEASAGAGTVPPELIAHLKLREGWRTKVYLDSLGLPTVGLGHLLTAGEKKQYSVGDQVPSAVLEAWVQTDVGKAYDAALSQAATLGVSDQSFINALASVNFQLGTGWNGKHKKTWAYMVAGEWEKAALEAQGSTWQTQTPVRVKDFQDALRALVVGAQVPEKKPEAKVAEPVSTTPPAATYEFKIGPPAGQGTVSGSALNVRKGPGTSYEKTGTVLKLGAPVTTYGWVNGWHCIGPGQWVAGQFLSFGGPSKGAAKPGLPATAPIDADLKAIAANVWAAMFGGISIGTDEEAVYSNLAKLNHDRKRIRDFKELYHAIYGTDVIGDIQSEFSNNALGDELAKALGYLHATLPASVGAVVRKQVKPTAASSKQTSPAGGAGVLAWPVDVAGSTVTSCYGWRELDHRNHPGIDIAQTINTPVYAAAAGVVIEARPASGYGAHFVAIRHSPVLVTSYGHMNAHEVKSKDTVAAGEKIGLVGNQGVSTGPHLHFNVIAGKNVADVFNGNVDPLSSGLSIPPGVPHPKKC
jgi:murein DD-endopeptidase MepM/ murein hydrolase activator NlpD